VVGWVIRRVDLVLRVVRAVWGGRGRADEPTQRVGRGGQRLEGWDACHVCVGYEVGKRLIEHLMWRSSRDVKRSEPETSSGTRVAGTYIPWESGADVATNWIA
jgi:hypothetical protein